jgi:Na+-transporting methylmalonyl-CoA/oxaloacetate decarboxylase gamma subunit
MKSLLLSANSLLLADAGKTVLIGALVVFAVLVALTLIFRLFGVFGGVRKEENAAAESVPEELIAAIAGVITAESDEVTDEVAAVIAAAVAAMSDEKTRYKVRRITPVGKSTRPVWAAAGIAQNTTPF